MRWMRWVMLISWMIVGSGIALVLSCASKAPAKTEMTAEQKVVRGRYLSTIMGCADCHTPGTFYGAPDTTRMLAGSELGWQGPWGVSYARNLTPDAETGIASWSEQDIVNSIRTGHRPDGSVLLPPMPWQDFSFLTDDDVFAVAAYMKSLPAVKHKSPDRILPGAAVTGAVLAFPPPPAWDAMNLPPPPAGAAPGDAKKKTTM